MNRQIRRRLKRKGLDARQIKVYAHLHSHCFFGPRCWPSQKLIGERCGMSRQLVNRVCQELRDAGVIDWEQQHKRGSQNLVNVYTLRYWSRPKVAGTMRVLRRRNQCSKVLPDTKGQSRRALAPERDERHRDQSTGKAQRSLTADVRRTTSAGQVTTAVGRERENGLSRRTWMQEARFHRHHNHLAVPDLTCPTCQQLAEELDRTRNLLRSQAVETSKVVEELSGAHEVARAAGKEVTKLKGQLTRQANESVLAEKIDQVVCHWRSHRPRTTTAFGKPTSQAYKVIEKALALMAEDEAGPVAACCEAIDGLHMAPWWSYGKRYAKPGPGRDLKRDLEHALGNEKNIERCRQVVRWSENHAARAVDYSRAIRATAEEWERRAFGEVFYGTLNTSDGFIEVDGIVHAAVTGLEG